MTSTSAGVRDSARAANKPPKPQPTMTICARPFPVNTLSARPSPKGGGDQRWLQARVPSRRSAARARNCPISSLSSAAPAPAGDNNMPGNDTSATDPRAPVRLPAALTSMPVQLVLLFVVLAAIDLACQWLGARLVHVTPAPLADAA